MSNWTKDKVENSPLTALATIDGQEKVIKALRDELEAVKANMGVLEIYHKDINKIKADAIRSVTEQGFEYSVELGEWNTDWTISVDDITEYANQVEKGQ